MQREMIRSQDRNSSLVDENLMTLKSKDPELGNVMEYVIKVNGVYKDVFLYICSNPYERKEVNFKLIQFLGTNATTEWYELIHKSIHEFEIEAAALSYCMECIHQAFLADIELGKVEEMLSRSRTMIDLNNNFNLQPAKEDDAKKELSKKPGYLEQAISEENRKEELASKGIFLKSKMPDYEGYVRIPTKLFYLENNDEPFMLRGDIWNAAGIMLKKIQRSFWAYQRRIDTLNRILISKDELIKKLSQNSDL